MKQFIVTEGKLDQIILRGILRSEPRLRGRFEIEIAGGLSPAISLARSYLATSDAAVLLVLDAETTDPDLVPAKHREISELLAAVAPKDRFEVVLAIPEVEIVLFSDRNLAESLFKRHFDDEEWAWARANPKLELGQIVQGTPTQIVNLSKVETLLNENDLTPFLKLRLFKQISDFIMHRAHRAA